MSKYIMFGKTYDYLRKMWDIGSEFSQIDYIDNLALKVPRLYSLIYMKMLGQKKFISFRRMFAKKLIFPKLINKSKDEEFIIICGINWFGMFKEDGYSEYVRNLYPHCHIIALFTDNASRYDKKLLSDFSWSDWVITFNPKDVIERHYGFYCDVNSILHKDLYHKKASEYLSDIVFVGTAKDRLEQIHNTYFYFHNMGLKCLYYIDQVSEKDQLSGTDIIYNKRLSYSEVQYLSATARCILEISTANANGFTARMEEAMMYNTKIITDREFIKHFSYYKPSNIFVYQNIQEVKKEWILNENLEDYGYDDDFGIAEVLKLIENHFSEKPSFPCTKWQEKGDDYIKQLCQY